MAREARPCLSDTVPLLDQGSQAGDGVGAVGILPDERAPFDPPHHPRVKGPRGNEAGLTGHGEGDGTAGRQEMQRSSRSTAGRAAARGLRQSLLDPRRAGGRRGLVHKRAVRTGEQDSRGANPPRLAARQFQEPIDLRPQATDQGPLDPRPLERCINSRNAVKVAGGRIPGHPTGGPKNTLCYLATPRITERANSRPMVGGVA